MKNTLRLIVFLGLALLVSCAKDNDMESKLIEEEQELGKYMETNHPNAEKLNNGLYYLKAETGNDKGSKPDAGGVVLINFTCKYLYENTYEWVSDKDYETYKPVYYPAYAQGGPELWQLSAPLFGIYEGISKMREQEKASFFVSSRFEATDHRSRRYDVELVKVIPNLSVYQEDSLIRKFIKYNAWEADSLPATSQIDNNVYKVFYAITDSGKGADVSKNAAIKINRKTSYMLLPNTPVFYESVDETIPQGESWLYDLNIREILTNVKQGGSVTILLPFKIAYGDSVILSNDNRKQQVIPQGSVVIFEIKVSQ